MIGRGLCSGGVRSVWITCAFVALIFLIYPAVERAGREAGKFDFQAGWLRKQAYSRF
jgi:hypothetical protein